MDNKPCAVRKTVSNGAYDKETLVNLAKERQLTDNRGKVYSISALRKIDKGLLCDMLGLEKMRPVELPKDEDRDCGPNKSTNNPFAFTKEELVQKLKSKSENKYSLTELRLMDKDKLCKILFNKEVPVLTSEYEKEKCMIYTIEQLRKFLKDRGLYISGSKRTMCERLNKYEETGSTGKPPEGIKKKELVKRDVMVVAPSSVDSKEIDEDSCMIPLNKDFKLKEHQTSIVKHLLKHRGILAIRPTGYGKTLIAVAAINCILQKYPNLSVDWIAPLGLIRQYPGEFKKFGLKIDYKRIHFYSYEEYYHSNYDKDGDQCRNKFLIIDESHRLRNPIVYKKGELAEGAISLVLMKCARRAFKVLLLTATPFVNRPEDIINQISVIDGTPFTSAPGRKTFYNKIIMNPDLFNAYFKCKVSLLPKLDLADYPFRVDQPIVKFKMTPEYYAAYYAIQSKELAMFGETSPLSGSLSTKYYQSLRRASIGLDGLEDLISPKIDWTIDFLRTANQNKKGVIVFTAWKESGVNKIIDKLTEEDIPYVTITGETTQLQRKRAVDAINEKKVFIVLVSPAGGVGLDFKNLFDVILMEPNWNPSQDEQIIGRAIRYKALSDLPAKEQVVNVWRLMMIKPDTINKGDSPKSVDVILHELSYKTKKPIIDDIMERLKSVSIESQSCDCKGEYCERKIINLDGELVKRDDIFTDDNVPRDMSELELPSPVVSPKRSPVRRVSSGSELDIADSPVVSPKRSPVRRVSSGSELDIADSPVVSLKRSPLRRMSSGSELDIADSPVVSPKRGARPMRRSSNNLTYRIVRRLLETKWREYTNYTEEIESGITEEDLAEKLYEGIDKVIKEAKSKDIQLSKEEAKNILYNWVSNEEIYNSIEGDVNDFADEIIEIIFE